MTEIGRLIVFQNVTHLLVRLTLNGSLENGNNKSGSRLNGLKNFTFEIYEISSNTIVMHAAK